MGNRAGGVERLEPRQIPRGKFKHPRGGDQGRFGLQQVRTVNGEERLALFDLIADLGKELDDPALIGREHLHCHILIEIDAPDRGLLDQEFVFADWLDLDRCEL